MLVVCLSLPSYRPGRDCASSPTRRSSDLDDFGGEVQGHHVLRRRTAVRRPGKVSKGPPRQASARMCARLPDAGAPSRSEEHTSELQSLTNHVCRLLLEKTTKKDTKAHQSN